MVVKHSHTGSENVKKHTYLHNHMAGPVSTAGIISQPVLDRLQFRFLGQERPFTSCQLLVKGLALSIV